MSDLRPRLSDIRFSFELLSSFEVQALDDRTFRALMNLIRFSAAGLVWTYNPPGDGSFADDDVQLARVTSLSLRNWKKVRPQVARFFRIARGRWHLNREWVSVEEGAARTAIPLAIQALARSREGMVCTYCGDTNGPFDHDHIFPVSRGGKNDPSNLTIACSSCNRSKGARTLREWMASHGK